MYHHIPNESAFNGSEQVKLALIDALTPKAWQRLASDEVPDHIAPLFSLSFDEGSTKELYKFYGLHYPFWCLVVFLYHMLGESEKRSWLLTLLKSIKPGVSLRDINFDYLTWATRRTGLKPGTFSADDLKDVEMSQKILYDPMSTATEITGAGLVMWSIKATLAKIEWMHLRNPKKIAKAVAAAGIVGCRLARLSTPAELTEKLLTLTKERS